MASVRAAFSEAVRDGLVKVNPAAGIKHHLEAPPRARVLTDDEMVGTDDLRRSFGLSIARSHGLHVASRLLRHANTTVTGQVCAPLGLDELREASQRRADALPFAPKAKETGRRAG